MRKVTISQGFIGLVFKREKLVRVLTEGSYWLGFGESIVSQSMSERANLKQLDSKQMAMHELLQDYITVVDVKDNQIVICKQDGRYQSVLTSGTYVFWNGYVEYDFTYCDLSKVEITENVDFEVLKRYGVVQYIRQVKVESYQKALLFIDGKLDRTLGAGTYYFWKNEIAIEVLKADIRAQQAEVNGQEILTKDKAAIRINYDVKYKVVDIEKALTENNDYQKQLYVLVQLALRSYVGALTLDELLEKKDAVSGFVQSQISEQAKALGIEVLSSGMRDVILNGDMKEIMNKVLIAQKQAEANVITRREETASTRSLLNTAKLMENNGMLFKLKEMEYIEKIAEKINGISVSGGGQIAGQLKELFGSG
ncbi:MAG: slipin family protein [Bacteroidia bacterium]